MKRSNIIKDLRQLKTGSIDLQELRERYDGPQDVPWLYIKESEGGEFREYDGTVHTQEKIRELALTKNLVVRFQSEDTLAIQGGNTTIKVVKQKQYKHGN